eukprot:Ihof_evm4s640 gene=Ihof_evmTU4s640
MSRISFEEILAGDEIDFTVDGNCLIANLDMNGPVDVDFISDENQWIVDAYGRFCWYRTAARYLAVSSHINPGVTEPLPKTVVSEEQFNNALPKILLFAAIGHILETHGTCPNAPKIVIRVSDSYSNDAWTAVAVPNSGLRRCEILIAQWWNKAREKAEVAQKVVEKVRMLAALAVANALIRHETDGHNFIADDLDNPTSATARALDVGGDHRCQLADFAKENNVGNDAWHPLTDQSLDNLVDSITGQNGIQLPQISNTPGITFKYHIGVNIAAIHRWPIAELSIAAIYIGLNFCQEMFSDIYKRHGPPIMNGVPFDHKAAVEAIIYKMSNRHYNREEIVSLRNGVTPTLVKACGYAACTVKGREIIDSTPVINKVCSVNDYQFDSGKAIFALVQKKDCGRIQLQSDINQIAKYAAERRN